MGRSKRKKNEESCCNKTIICSDKTFIVCKKKRPKKKRRNVIVKKKFVRVVCPQPSFTPFRSECSIIPSSTFTFVNNTRILLPPDPDVRGNPYPSTIVVSGLTEPITKVTATLFSIDHFTPVTIRVLLVHPNGTTNTVLMSSAGGAANLDNVTLTFDDNAANFLPFDDQIVSGTFKPTNYAGINNFPAATDPSVSPPPTSSTIGLSNFNRLEANGTWRLYVTSSDLSAGNVIEQGWALSFTTPAREVCTFTAL